MDIFVCEIILFIINVIPLTLQTCPEEVTSKGISVTWHQTSEANNIKSDPLCFVNTTQVTRNCSQSGWIPALDDLEPCSKVVKYFDLTSCPPGYHRITENNNEFCYQLEEPSSWDFPCFASGGASVITDLSSTEIRYVLDSLKETNVSRYFWLPAKRQNIFHPMTWTIPGPNWGQVITSTLRDTLPIQIFFAQQCLLLDIYRSVLIAESCTKVYPSLCFYINDLHYPAKCPKGYHAFRFTPDKGACYGIATTTEEKGLSFNDFLTEKCKSPMSDNEDLSRFIFTKIASLDELPNDVWCWYEAQSISLNILQTSSPFLKGIINNAGILGAIRHDYLLSCMACEVEVTYPETELMFEYNNVQNLLYLTVYHPSGLWKYDVNDKGIQCFSDAKGFVRVINVNDNPLIDIQPLSLDAQPGQIEKIVYVIDLVSDSSAQYWCEGHTVNFTLIFTKKIIVNPRGNNIHVFSLTIEHYTTVEYANITSLTNVGSTIKDIFNAQKVLLMDILNPTSDRLLLILHLHVAVENIYENKELATIQETYYSLKDIAETKLSAYNYTFINLTSAVYCLATTSTDTIELDWEPTVIGHITAPKQFCLQSNGLPVKRRCEGSYLFGGIWGEVEGHCDNIYKPSETTTLLYNFMRKSHVNVSKFLTEDLSFVLGDPDIIIPADIYYLSMSLQQISDILQENNTNIDSTDIQHIAWIMDRVMIFDCDYLRLAQTLNSTNVIVNAISDIIETTAKTEFSNASEHLNDSYRLAIEPQFVVQISYPDFNNITGIAIVNHLSSNYFTHMMIYPLYKNTSLEEVLSIENLEIATWIPTNLLDTIKVNNYSEDTSNEDTDVHVVITVYHNDAVFQELQNNSHSINSRIIGISIPGYISNLEHAIPIVFKPMYDGIDSFCGYWDFHLQQVDYVPGSWKKEGCVMVRLSNSTIICECYHLTHFGQLLSFANEIDKAIISKRHSIALNIITLGGSFLSLLGITGIWVTALIFGNWRKKPGSKVLLQLSTAISLPLIIIIYFNLDYSMFIKVDEVYTVATQMEVTCIVLGALLHFSILSSFMWMLITAVLQFIRYVRVLGVKRPARFMFKFTLIGWGIPLIPVVASLSINPYNYIPAPSTVKKICYPTNEYFIFTVLVPICVILFVNITLFLSVLYAISRGSNRKMKSTEMDLVRAQFRVSILLFFLLGLTWIFGILSFSNNLIFSYIFCLTSTIQGFVLFIYFVICDPNTRSLWVTLIKPPLSPPSPKISVTSISG